jgi:hypothetical protein
MDKQEKRNQCDNCIWYRDLPKECRRIMGDWKYKHPLTVACPHYKPDRSQK